MRQAKWLIFGMVALFLAWRIIAVNISQHLAATGDPAAVAWKRDTPQALLSEAFILAKTDIKRARAVAQDTVFYNPANGVGLLMLAELWEQEGNVELAKNAANIAHLLAPSDADVQLPLGGFWLRRGLPVQALSHWVAAVKADPALFKTLSPVMLQIADAPQTRLAAAEVLAKAPKQWGQFFMYALKNSLQEDTLKAMYAARGEQVEHEQRRAYIDHLISAGLYTDAYFVWLNGLPTSQLAALGNIYDGGFEHALSDEGFGWRLSVSKGFMLAAEPTYGHGGKKALHVAFQQKLSSRDLVRQFLMLDAGKYRFNGKSRLDNLSAGKGLRWDVACADRDGKALLGGTEHFVGTDGWNKFATEFEVPSDKCEVQVLRLWLNAGNDYDETAFSGSAWFDDLEIVKVD